MDAKFKKRLKFKAVTILSMVILVSIFHFTIFLSSSIAEGISDQTQLFQKLRSGNHFVMIRHALAPGMGDPENFAIDRCETQRNLSDEGREQARNMGDLFRRNNIESAEVYSSQWCRCLETARLMNLGEVNESKTINSFFRRFEKEEEQTKELALWIKEQDLSRPIILITHQVNITAFTGIFPSSGEIIVVHRGKDGNFTVEGTMKTD